MRRAGIVLAVGLAAAGIAALSWLGSDSLADTAAVVQTAGVLIGVALAVTTLRGDRRDKQVDRVLELHREWMSGELHEARIRLHEHLRWDEGTGDFRILSFGDLRHDPTREEYPAGTPGTPIQDAGVILRFFERANAALAADAVHQQLFFRLVARNAAWWNLAIDDGSAHVPRRALRELVDWAERYRLEARGKGDSLWQASISDVFRASKDQSPDSP